MRKIEDEDGFDEEIDDELDDDDFWNEDIEVDDDLWNALGLGENDDWADDLDDIWKCE